MSAHGTLRQARELISRPENWTKESYARDSRGLWTDVRSGRAVCFCAMGALYRATDGGGLIDAERALSIAMGGDSVEGFNDDPSTTHADVLQAYDRAIEATRPSEGV